MKTQISRTDFTARGIDLLRLERLTFVFKT